MKHLKNLDLMFSSESGRSTPTTVTSGGSTAGVSSSLGRGTLRTLPYAGLQHPQLQDWTLLPDAHRNPPPPVLLYGHIHLLRLFGRLLIVSKFTYMLLNRNKYPGGMP